MIVFQVPLLESSYPILLGECLLVNSEVWQRFLKGREFCVITDDAVFPLYLDHICKGLNCLSSEAIIFPNGERHKNLETLTHILTKLTARHFPRDGILIALGGGVVGDMVGFAASIYHRGVKFIQVPTTTLAMLDSSVGGKTAVNLGEAKNNIGAFHQPLAVVMDLSTLATLNEREYKAGLAEAIKHALIQSPKFFYWLVQHTELILKCDPVTLAELIQRSCEIKANIVCADEREQNIRMLLNFGHTFGHAIEAYSHYQDFKHGEAVAIGMMCALRFTQAEPTLIKDAAALLSAFGLPLVVPATYQQDKLLELMQHDKKKRDGRLNLVLVQELGKAFIKQEDLCKIHF